MLFAINNVDLTEHIIAGSYQVNEEDAYEEWKDGWGTTHHDIWGVKCSGSFEMLFRTFADYIDFIELMKSAKKRSGWYDCQIAANNTGDVGRKNCFITFAPKRDRDGVNRDYFGKFTVTVEEA